MLEIHQHPNKQYIANLVICGATVTAALPKVDMTFQNFVKLTQVSTTHISVRGTAETDDPSKLNDWIRTEALPKTTENLYRKFSI